MRGWQVRLWKYIIYAVERAFAEGASTPAFRPVIMISAPFAIPTEVAKQTGSELQK
jgi:hypothetical protein